MACIFCQIIEGTIPGTFVYQGDEIVAIRDIAPQAPVHVLVMPRQHIGSIADLGEQDGALLGKLIAVVNEVAQSEGIAQSGFRLIANVGPDSGQAVPHLHLHVLGGRRLGAGLVNPRT